MMPETFALRLQELADAWAARDYVRAAAMFAEMSKAAHHGH